MSAEMMGDEQTQVATQPDVDQFLAPVPETPVDVDTAPALAVVEPQHVEEKCCSRCKLRLPNIGKNGQCRSCGALRSMLARHLGKEWPLPEFESLSAEEQRLFWQEAGAVKDSRGVLQYERVKTMLADRIVKARYERQAISEGGAYKPLTVWAAEGYNTSKIEAQCPSMFNQSLDEWCYLVELLHVNKETMFEKVTSEITEIERRVRKRKGANAQLADLSEEEPEEAAPPGATEDEIAELRAKKAKALEKKEAKEARREQKKAQKAVEKEEKAKQKETRDLMNKACTPLGQVVTALKKLQDSKKLKITQEQHEELEKKTTCMEAWRAAVLQNLARFAKDQNSKLAAMPFDKAQLNSGLKAAKTFMADLERASRAAEGGA